MTIGNGIPVLRPDGFAVPSDRAVAGHANLVSRGLETLAAADRVTAVVPLTNCSTELKQAILLQARGQVLEAAMALRDLEKTGEPEALWWYALTLTLKKILKVGRPGFDAFPDDSYARFLHSADAGFLPAQVWIAAHAENEISCGRNVQASQSDAVRWASRAANAGSFAAMVILAKLHFFKQLPQNSAAEAKCWFETAARRGNKEAQHYLARIYERENAYDQAARWHLSATTGPSSWIQDMSSDSLGALLQDGRCDSIIPHDPEFWFRHALLGDGWLLDCSPHTRNWLKTKSEQGNSFATEVLNHDKLSASESPFYLVNAITLAHRGSTLAQRVAGKNTDNAAERARWYASAAGSGDHPSMYELGLLKLHNATCSADLEVGMGLLRKAADLGNAAAQQELAVRLAHGIGVAPADEEAVHWARQYVIQSNESLMTLDYVR